MLYLIISTLALTVISVAMLGRANDLGTEPGLFWHGRRIGLAVAGFAPWGIVLYDWLGLTSINLWEVLFRVGVAIVFVTSPHMPPFWKWLTGEVTINERTVKRSAFRTFRKGNDDDAG